MSRTPRFAKNLVAGLFRRLRPLGMRAQKASCSQQLRTTCLSSAGGEKLEQRLALAVSVLEFPTGGPTDWATVLVGEGSDAYVKAVATAGQDIYVADNASFVGRDILSGGNAGVLDEVHVYNGILVNREIDHANRVGTPLGPDVSSASVGYPWFNGITGELAFPLTSSGLDFTESILGSITLSDGTANSTMSFSNNGGQLPFGQVQITSGPGAGTSMNYTLINQSDALVVVFRNPTYFSGLTGQTATPSLQMTYDTDTNPASDRRDFVGANTIAITTSGGSPNQFRIFDPNSQQYVPGSMQGRLGGLFGGASWSVDWQVDDPGVGDRIPISFTNARTPESQILNISVRNGNGDIRDYLVFVTGTFDSNEGILSFSYRAESNETNGGFDGPITIGGELREFSVGLRDIDPTNDPGDPLGLLYDDQPNAFTLFDGMTFLPAIVADLPTPDSEVVVESPVTANNEIRLSASSVMVNSPVRSGTSITIPSGDASGFGTITERVTINAAVGAPGFDIRLGDNPLTETITRSRLVVTQSGSLSNLPDVLSVPPQTLPSATQAYIEIEEGDAFVEGRVVATSQTWIMQSDQMVADVVSNIGDYPNFTPYLLTTKSALTGIDTGTIEATTFAVTLANDTLVLPAIPPVTSFVPSRAFSVLDVTTDVARLRVQAADRGGDPLEVPFPYDIIVREEDDLFVDAVAATSRPINIQTGEQLNLLGHIQSYGDVSLTASAEFTLLAPVTTVFGEVAIEAPAVNVNAAVRVLDTVQDERDVDVRITATSGDLFIEDAVAGINRVILTQESDEGGITGDGRIFADVLEINAEGSVNVRTAASRTSVRTPADVFVEELDYGIFEIRDASDVTLVANGFDQIVSESDFGGVGNRAFTAPALYADLYDATTLTVSAPNGSVDVLANGTGVLNIGALNRIGSGTETRMEVSGSTVIRSTLGTVTVHDAPSATGNATRVAVATELPLNGSYQRGSAGVIPARITNSKIAKSSGKLLELDGIEFGSLRAGDLVLVKNGVVDPNVGLAANGIYQVLALRYPVDDPATPLVDESQFVEVDLVRSPQMDTTEELSQKHYVRVTSGDKNADTVWTADGSDRNALGQPIYEGWGASNEYRFTNVFDNDPLVNPVTVREIMPRTGFLPVRMMTEVPLLNGQFRAQYNSNGVIRGDGPDFKIPNFNGVTPRVDDLVLVAEGAGDGNGKIDPRSSGVYRVTGLGDGSANQWELTRYEGVDTNGDGTIDRFYTGRVAVNEGSLRTAKTGKMFEVGLMSLGWVPLRYQPVAQYAASSVVPFDSVLNYQTVIGTGRPGSPVTFNVSTNEATNEATGSFGRMLTLVQANAAINSRLGVEQEQLLQFAPSVDSIELVQSLPDIYRPLTIQAGGPVFVDGTQIEFNAQGQVVRSGAVLTRLGPVSPTEVTTARRLVRDQSGASFADVNGLTFGPGSAGSVVSGLSFGGFNNGAAISVRAPDVLVDSVTIGRDRAGQAVANRVGVEFIVPAGGTGVQHSTLLNSTIVSAGVGVQINSGAERVHVVGNTIGVDGSGNQRGIELLGTTANPSFIGASGASAVSPITVSGRVISIDQGTDQAVVQIDRSTATQYVRKDMFLLDSNSGVDRRIIDMKYSVANDDEFWVLTLADASKTNSAGSGQLVTNGNVSGQIGHRLESGVGGVPTTSGKVTAGDTELILPPTFAEGDVFLGMEISSLQPGVGTANPVVGIRNYPGGVVGLELQRPVSETSFSLLVVEQPAPNAIVGNGDGIVVDSVSSRIVNTEVRNSVYDGIRVERTDLNGKHVIGDAVGTVPGLDDPAGNPTQVTPTSLQNVIVVGNGLAGIRLSDEAFRALAALAGPPNDVADYATIDSFLNDHLVIRGNSLGVDGDSNVIGNGASGTENIVVDLSPGDTHAADQARIEYLLFDDTSVRNPGNPGDPNDDLPEARLRPVIATGIDSLANQHGIGEAGVGTQLPGTEIGDRRPIIR